MEFERLNSTLTLSYAMADDYATAAQLQLDFAYDRDEARRHLEYLIFEQFLRLRKQKDATTGQYLRFERLSVAVFLSSFGGVLMCSPLLCMCSSKRRAERGAR